MHRILIADDDPRMRQTIKAVVADLASEVFEARDGAEAIAVYVNQRPDWGLMDWRMKPLDGLRATALLKAQFPEARIIMVSQYVEPQVRRAAVRSGACAYVPKENLVALLGIPTTGPDPRPPNQA